MKTTGIVLIVLGILSTIGGIMATISGREPNLAGLTFVVLGAYLIHRANQKKKDAESKKRWEEGNMNEN